MGKIKTLMMGQISMPIDKQSPLGQLGLRGLCFPGNSRKFLAKYLILLVEAAGIEPASENHLRKASTCVVRILVYPRNSHGQDFLWGILLDFALAPQANLRTIPH